MTKKELFKLLEPYSEDVLIYLYTDHGQISTQADSISVTKNKYLPLLDEEEDIRWRGRVRDVKLVTAISLNG